MLKHATVVSEMTFLYAVGLCEEMTFEECGEHAAYGMTTVLVDHILLASDQIDGLGPIGPLGDGMARVPAPWHRRAERVVGWRALRLMGRDGPSGRIPVATPSR